MIGGDGINDESNKTAPAPTRNTDLTKYKGIPQAHGLRRLDVHVVEPLHDERGARMFRQVGQIVAFMPPPVVCAALAVHMGADRVEMDLIAPPGAGIETVAFPAEAVGRQQVCVCSIESGPCERVDVFHVSGRFWSTSACGEKRTPARPAWTSFPS